MYISEGILYRLVLPAAQIQYKNSRQIHDEGIFNIEIFFILKKSFSNKQKVFYIEKHQIQYENKNLHIEKKPEWGNDFFVSPKRRAGG